MSDRPSVVIAYHSGRGHTAVLARAVAEGARAATADASTLAVDSLTEAHWSQLDHADAIVFGSPTYMGNVSAGFQTFAEHTSRRCVLAPGKTRSPPASPIRAPRVATSCTP